MPAATLVRWLGNRKPKPRKIINAQSASPPYFAKKGGNPIKSDREPSPRPMVKWFVNMVARGPYHVVGVCEGSRVPSVPVGTDPEDRHVGGRVGDFRGVRPALNHLRSGVHLTAPFP